MKKNHFLNIILLVVAIFAPQTTFAASVLDGLINIPAPEVPKMMSCNVEGSIKRINNTTNQVTYKVHYGSNYRKVNTPFTVFGTVERPAANLTLYQLRGNLTVLSGEGYFSINGKQENTFTFPIKDNPGVTVKSTVDGIVCGSSYFKTIQPFAITSSALGISPKIQLDQDALVQPSINLPPASQPSGSGVGSVNSNSAAIDASGAIIRKPNIVLDGNGASSGAADIPAEVTPDQEGSVPAEGTGENGVDQNDGAVADPSKISEENKATDSEALKILDDGEGDLRFEPKDIAIVGLLGSIFIAFVVYIVLKYRGRM